MSKPFTCSLGTPCYLQAFGAIHPFSGPKRNLHILFTVGLSFLQALRAIASCRSPPLLAACPKPEGDEENSLPWGALVRQRSRLSELPVILYMQWMALRSKGGDFVVYSSSSLFVCIFPHLSLLHFSSCTQKYEICSPAAEGEHGAFWQTEAANNTSPGWHSREWSLSSFAKWLCAFWEHRLDPSASQRLSRTMLKAPSSVCIYPRKDALVPLGIG